MATFNLILVLLVVALVLSSPSACRLPLRLSTGPDPRFSSQKRPGPWPGLFVHGKAQRGGSPSSWRSRWRSLPPPASRGQ
jgi:hypothetical protein